ncbi:MAG: helix-turn-helix transcriptional regulator [Burkholderiaceae bacterium]|nr:MAG: helix-turn-helix transcriptional regulator [Burkholderiaceae bacterium]
MINIGVRLRAERERLELTQDSFAEAVGVSKRSLINYEKGERSPDAELLAAAAVIGMDVLFVLTGQRSQALPPTAELPPRVRALVDNYIHTDEAGRAIIEATATAAAQSKKAASAGRK